MNIYIVTYQKSVVDVFAGNDDDLSTEEFEALRVRLQRLELDLALCTTSRPVRDLAGYVGAREVSRKSLDDLLSSMPED